jgi:hypothetical protein
VTAPSSARPVEDGELVDEHHVGAGLGTQPGPVDVWEADQALADEVRLDRRAAIGVPLPAHQDVLRYGAAFLLLAAMARPMRAVIVRPRGREWCYLAGIAATGLVLFNVAVVRGDAHAEPAVVAGAVACVPVLLGVVGRPSATWRSW